MRQRTRFAGSGVAFAAALAVATFFPSCTRTQDVSFVLKLPGESKDATKWIEIGAYASGTCPTITQLSGGLPRGSLLQRVGFEYGEPAPKFRLDKGTYSFAATARNENCEVLSAGCTNIEVPGSSEIAITLKTSSIKGGKCQAGSACTNAECVISPGSGGAGAGCTLEVVGAGPLEALDQDGQNLSRPAISPVSDGFVIGYGQIKGTKYRVTTMKVGYDGGPVRADETTSFPYNRFDFGGACQDDARTEGLGLLFETPQAASGTLVVPRSPRCTREPIPIFGIKPDAHLISTEPFSAKVNEPEVTHVMSNHPIATGGYMTTVLRGQALLASGARPFENPPPVAVGGTPPHQRSWVAASTKGLAVLTQAAGGDTGPIDPEAGAPLGDAPELRLEVADLNGTPTLGMAPLLHGRFGSLAIQERRVVVVTSGQLAAPVEYHILDIGSNAYQTASVSTQEKGDTLSADIALSGNRMYIAVVQSLGVSIFAFDDVATTPKQIKVKALARDFRVKQFMGGIFDTLKDGYVAIAANNPFVGVVWMTGADAGAGEAVGGWAVLACR